MRQLNLFMDERPLVVMRLREDQRIEVRWPHMELYATFANWRVALDFIGFYDDSAGVAFADASVRVRP